MTLNEERFRNFLEDMGNFGFLLIDGREVIYEVTREEGQLMLKEWDCGEVEETREISLDEVVSLEKRCRYGGEK